MGFNTDWNRVHDEVQWLTEPDGFLLKFLDTHYRAGEDRIFLDVGCGTGASTLPMLERGFRVIAVDGAPMAVSDLRARVGENPNLGCIVCDASTLEIKPQSLDAVIDGVSFSMMPFLDVASIVRKSRTWLKPGGRIFSKMLKMLPPPQFNRTYARATTVDEISLLFDGFYVEVRETREVFKTTGEPMQHFILDAQLVEPLP